MIEEWLYRSARTMPLFPTHRGDRLLNRGGSRCGVTVGWRAQEVSQRHSRRSQASYTSVSPRQGGGSTVLYCPHHPHAASRSRDRLRVQEAEAGMILSAQRVVVGSGALVHRWRSMARHRDGARGRHERRARRNGVRQNRSRQPPHAHSACADCREPDRGGQPDSQ